MYRTDPFFGELERQQERGPGTASAVRAALAAALIVGGAGCGGRSRPLEEPDAGSGADASAEADAPVEANVDGGDEVEDDADLEPHCAFEPAPPDDGELTVERFLGRLLDAYCLMYVACESKSDGLSVLGEAFLCHHQGPERLEYVRMTLRFIEEGSVLFQAAEARACLDGLGPTETCLGMSDVLTSGPCREALLPQLADEEPCMDGEQCSAGRCLGAQACEGRCGPPREPGEPCDGALDCAEGSFCNERFVCEAQRGDGAPCSDDVWGACESGVCEGERCAGPLPAGAPCHSNQACEGSLLCLDGVCREGRRLGEACTSTQECADARCLRGRCEAPRGPHDPCETSDQCAWLYLCHDGSCVPLPSEGESCDPVEFPCFIGACEACSCELLGHGEPCSRQNPAYPCGDGYCDPSTDRCVPFLGEGEPCSDGYTCGPGSVCSDEEPPRCRPACP